MKEKGENTEKKIPEYVVWLRRDLVRVFSLSLYPLYIKARPFVSKAFVLPSHLSLGLLLRRRCIPLPGKIAGPLSLPFGNLGFLFCICCLRWMFLCAISLLVARVSDRDDHRMLLSLFWVLWVVGGDSWSGFSGYVLNSAPFLFLRSSCFWFRSFLCGVDLGVRLIVCLFFARCCSGFWCLCWGIPGLCGIWFVLLLRYSWMIRWKFVGETNWMVLTSVLKDKGTRVGNKEPIFWKPLEILVKRFLYRGAEWIGDWYSSCSDSSVK